MPNHCENHTYVYGPKDALLYFANAIKFGKEDMGIADNLIPCPPELRENDGWYNWCVGNWGTKWGDYEHQQIHDVADITDSIQLEYTTAWGPLGPQFWERVSRNFPTLSFVTTFEEGGMAFSGAIAARNGAVTEIDGTYPDGPEDWQDADAIDAYYDRLSEMRDDLHAAGCRLLRL